MAETMTMATLGTVHALKVVYDATPEVASRLMEEGRLQASLRHPNVVGVTDVLVVNGHSALLADFVSGGSLRARLRTGISDLKEAERLFRGIVAGVSHAHDEGLAHRDLKPENVLLDDVSGTVVPRVADFGIARSLVGPHGRPRLTRTGEVMGTPSYLAPEQARSLRDADHRAGIFSLGAMLYELSCGTLAFPRADVLTTFRAAAAGDYVPPRERRGDLPERIVRAIDACLRPDRLQRPQNCEALLAILDGRDGVANARVITLRDTWDPDELREEQRIPTPELSLRDIEADEAAVAILALFTDAAGAGHAVDVMVRAATAPGAAGPEECTAEVRSAADIAVAVGARGCEGIRGVRWQVRGSGVRLSGESLGLALALATLALATGKRGPFRVGGYGLPGPGWARASR